MPGPEELFKQKQQQTPVFKTTDEIQYTRSLNNPFDNNMQVKKSAKTTDSIMTDEQEKEIFKNKLESVVSVNEDMQKTWNKVEDEVDLKVLQDRMAQYNLFLERHSSKENSVRLKKTLEENHPDLFKGIKANDELEKWIGLEICKENPELISNIRNNRQILSCFFNQIAWVNRTGDPDMDDPMYTQSKILEENKDLEGFAKMQTFANELELTINPESIRQDKTLFDMDKLVDAFKMSEEKATEKAIKDQNMLFTKKFIDTDIKALDKKSKIKQNR